LKSGPGETKVEVKVEEEKFLGERDSLTERIPGEEGPEREKASLSKKKKKKKIFS